MTRRACILLSASVPSQASQYVLSADERTRLDEAVMHIARATFSCGGRLVFGGHPAISPLVATIAGEYAEPAEGDRPSAGRFGREVPQGEYSAEDPLGNALTGIYQSRVFEGKLPDETLLLFRLGFARIRWTEAVDGEHYDGSLAAPASEQCPGSLRLLRETMISETRPDALVCAGGMSGVEVEIDLFRRLRPGAPIYLLGMTGGVTASLASEHRTNVRVMDREVLHRLQAIARESPGTRPEEKIRPTVLYPIVVQMIVREVLQRLHMTHEG